MIAPSVIDSIRKLMADQWEEAQAELPMTFSMYEAEGVGPDDAEEAAPSAEPAPEPPEPAETQAEVAAEIAQQNESAVDHASPQEPGEPASPIEQPLSEFSEPPDQQPLEMADGETVTDSATEMPEPPSVVPEPPEMTDGETVTDAAAEMAEPPTPVIEPPELGEGETVTDPANEMPEPPEPPEHELPDLAGEGGESESPNEWDVPAIEPAGEREGLDFGGNIDAELEAMAFAPIPMSPFETPQQDSTSNEMLAALDATRVL